jgi:hypothetical protein
LGDFGLKRRTVRQVITELYLMWWAKYRDRPMAVAELDAEIQSIIDPQNRGRQFQASYLARRVNTRMAGMILTRQAPAGKWGVATYALEMVEGDKMHRGHRGHRPEQPNPDPTSGGANGHPASIADPMPPMPPMPSAIADEDEWSMKI